MKIAVAGDSAGEPLARALAEYLTQNPIYEVTEASRTDTGPDDYYANLADRIGTAIKAGTYDRAILCCGTGIGVCLSANKVPGIRAAQTHDTYSAGKAATSNNAQIITMGARVVGAELAKDIADAFLSSVFDPAGKSANNVNAIDAVDAKYHTV
ncbi:RpiB/LacA/LacB family sugar-phosphate isomerase [Salipiger mucosus]|uniref:Ribose 5-phosphate isomerase B n=1 Tax=Salipiger mucosus DSM 16094 TaxID=1123237 RepID=S9Q2Y9_9RHOB|nr:RpiB/LacA/LacB family sugar-phosphate isomerase [Salipiger mucosus]EPX75676.1 Ribose 5-phosphate isomerase B [Salipiger mucosus DSM 16094]